MLIGDQAHNTPPGSAGARSGGTIKEYPGSISGSGLVTYSNVLPSVGDLKSQEKGSGARFSAGKPPVELLLWRYVAARYGAADDNDPTSAPPEVNALYWLGKFQETHDAAYLPYIVGSLYAEDDTLHKIDIDAANVFGYGAKKYASWNWAKGMPWSVPVGCMGRHLLAILWGEENDPESGFPHAGHVGCNVMMLQHYAEHYKEGNDLPPVELFK